MGNMNDFGFPFTSVGGDRQYSSLEWRQFFELFTSSGVVTGEGNMLKVNPQASPNKTVYVDTGAALVQGAMRVMPATTNLTIADNASGNPRIDRIVARINYTDRKIELAVKQGTPAASPAAPALTRDATAWEISLAKIAVANGFTTIITPNITDERSDTTVCGAANFTLGVIPPSGADAVTIMLSPATALLYELSGTDANADKALSILPNRLNKNFVSFLKDTVDKTWVVPAGVTKITIFACAAGVAPNAGAYILGQEYTVTPGQTISFTVGTGNTIISGAGLSITLVAGSITTSLNHTLFGPVLGTAGVSGGFGGAFGAGGGNGTDGTGGNGGGVGNIPGGIGTTATGGNGAKYHSIMSILEKYLPDLFTTAGGGSGVTGGAAGTGGSGIPGGGSYSGGGAAGYGAGGGNGFVPYGGTKGGSSPGMVLIGY